MDGIRVFKIGGHVVDSPERLEKFVREFSVLPGPKVLVHGGGAMAGRMQRSLGMEPVMVAGRRVTDSETLKTVTMVYAGWCNKSIVALLQKYGCNAIGLSGADGRSVTARRRPPVYVESAGSVIDYGHVGDIDPEGVDAPFIMGLAGNGYTPVFCAITCDGKGSLLNTNADTVASAIAVSLSSYVPADLIYCFEKNGVLADVNDPSSLIREITPESFRKLKEDGTVADGMLPKLENAFRAIASGIRSVTIRNSDGLGNGIQTVLRK